MTQIERIIRDTKLELLVSLLKLRKRIWIPDEDGKFQEMSDGAIPIYFIEEKIKELINKL